MPFTTTAEAVHAWVRGWTVSRGAAEPVARPWGFTVDVGLPHEVARHVLPAADEATVRRITEHTAAPAVWLKTFVPPRTLAAWLPPGWTLAGGPGFLMSAGTAAGAAPPALPEGYRLTHWTRAGVTRAVVRTADGAFAARAQVAVTGRTAVVDQVGTEPAHQRRGLGRVLMHALTDTAARAGATAAVLGATPEGRGLYESMGWRVLAPLTAATRAREDDGA
ncbi:GNAT family N-acetyltransferase [Streptomyces naphthomycinicus]|uniref:GNAT family N-acetyltransferase n=1 Tax=Streptomyces naphthomycinicus TaxID=2872625 RepID=UPI001CED60D6|nr:GNAT family N-acetyltransferase [Streptomyces sp. TML10]